MPGGYTPAKEASHNLRVLGGGARTDAALDVVPPYPDHRHCACALVPVVDQSPAQVAALRALMARDERPPYVTPASLVEFLRMLLGALVGEVV